VAIPILKTKLYIPPARVGQTRLVARPALIERLNESLRPGCKLVLVSAPAGFGKTTLVSAWIHSSEQPAAWLSLDQGDNDPIRFLAYLAAALQTIDAQLGSDALAALQSPQPPAWKAVLTMLINDLAANAAPLALVLDDYHEITTQAVHDALVFLLEHLPPHIHIVIATRIDPPWPLARLRARHAMIELRSHDLRFSREETNRFMNSVMGLGLSAEDLAILDNRTEGWITGLQMAALAMQAPATPMGQPAVFVHAFGASHRYVLDYLVEEVLDRQPTETQAFLLRTSILKRLTAPLCDAVVGGKESETLLAWLERANLFVVPLDEERCWYRYHRLFADLLRSRLLRTEPDLVPMLHRRASAWLERNDLWGEAIDHALDGGDLERAADLVEEHAEETLMRGEVATLGRWVDALPELLVRARPTLALYYAWTLLWQGQSLQAIESLLQDAETSDGRVAGSATALRGVVAAFQGQIRLAAELSRRALEQLPPEEQFARSYVSWVQSVLQMSVGDGAADSQTLKDVLSLSQQAGNVMLAFMVECSQAELSMRRGCLGQAAATYRRALERVTDARRVPLPIAGQALIGLAEISRERGDLESAARHLAEGIALLEQWTEVGPMEGYLCLARVYWAQGDSERARQAIEKARRLAVDYDLTDLDDLSVALVQARLWVAEGDLESAERWVQARDLYTYIDTPLQEKAGDSYQHRVIKYELPVLARLLIAQGRATEAIQALGPVAEIAEWRGRPGLLIEVYALQALAWQAQGKTERAHSALERALCTGEREGFVSVLVDEGEPMQRLLSAYRSNLMEQTASLDKARGPGSSVASLRAYVERLLAAYAPADTSTLQPSTSPAQPAPGSTLLEPLSERELQVLHLLATPFTQPEIASKLYVSVNTIRTHVKHIYAKLNVHSRTAAVERGEELHLL
jgi:LuxR family maltose regulon positive regulatory protein